MSILNWFVGTGENSGNEERNEGVGRSRSEKDSLASELMNVREENLRPPMDVMGGGLGGGLGGGFGGLGGKGGSGVASHVLAARSSVYPGQHFSTVQPVPV